MTTDKTIEIECPECPGHHFETGIQAMFDHIRQAHPHYNLYEAEIYADKWMEEAYDKLDLAEERAVKAYNNWRGKQ